jgi:hypothetical protein
LNVEIKIGADLPKLMEGVTDDIGDLAFQIASRVEAEAKRLLQHTVPMGRTYRVRHNKGERQPEITRVASLSLQRMGFRLSKRREGQVVVGYKLRRASAPGQPPATDTANLVNSMRAKRTGQMSAELAINASYAGFLEPPIAGETGVSEGLLNRPFVGPAIDFVLDHLPQQL